MRQKLPSVRYRIIDQCLRNKTQRFWPKTELLRKLEELDLHVGPRTLERDIQDMKYDERLAFFAPIEFKKHHGYYYTNPDFSIALNFGPKEYEALKVLVEFITVTWNRVTGH